MDDEEVRDAQVVCHLLQVGHDEEEMFHLPRMNRHQMSHCRIRPEMKVEFVCHDCHCVHYDERCGSRMWMRWGIVLSTCGCYPHCS